MLRTGIVFICFATILALGCMQEETEATAEPIAENTPEQAAPLNPNGDTELALLMRAAFEDGMAMKAAIKNGEIPESHLDLSNLYSLDAAEPKKVASDEYKAYAAMYEAAHEALNEADNKEEKIAAYKTIVSSCETCHKAMCPGPLVKIKKMKI